MILENKRLSAIVDEDRRASKRDSQASASTNTSSSSRPLKRLVGPWILGPTLGEGATGRVRKAKHAATGLPAAVKIVSKREAITMRNQSVRELDTVLGVKRRGSGRRAVPFAIDREMVIMKLVEHPNIIKLYDVWENRGEL